MHFRFKAIKKDGERYEGISESQSKFTLYNELKAEGSTLISAEEMVQSHFWKPLLGYFNFLGNISISQKIIFAKNLSAMTKAGLSLPRALSVIGKQNQNNRFKRVIEGLNQEIKKGKTLSEAFKNYPNVFSNLFVSMTRAGEESGALSQALANIALQMDRSYHLQRKIRGALVYPTVVFFVMIIVGILMFIFVVPGIISTFQDLNTTLPVSTKTIIFLSESLSNHWLLSIFSVLIFILLIYFSNKTVSGKKSRDRIIVRLPGIANIVKEANLARVARTLSSLLAASVPVAESLLITKEIIDNHLYRFALEEASRAIEKGENISSAFIKNGKYYPTFFGEMIAVGEETGNISAMLSEVATFYEKEVEEKTKDLSTIIEPVLMVIIGAAVGFFALSMITPIYSVMNNI